MAGEHSIPVDDVGKYQKLATHLLVDIKIFFIVTYVYITVVNLISTTANNEANQDVEGPTRFNVTSRPEHTDVIVKYVDDAVLWKCREHSLTSSYYVTMYWMLLAMLLITLSSYSVSKWFSLWNIKNFESLTDLWHLGILKLLMKNTEDYESSDAEDSAKYIEDLLNKDYPREYLDVEIPRRMKRQKRIACGSLVVSVLALGLCILSYDLHLLSCISGIEDSIDYDNTTQTVEVTFPEHVITIQRMFVSFASFFIIFQFVLAIQFRLNIKHIINKMKEQARMKINNNCQIDL